MKDNKGTMFFLNSLEGEFDQNNQKIHLYENVYLKNLEGLSFKTESAYIDLETKDPNLKKLGAGWSRNDGNTIGVAIAVDGWKGYFPTNHEVGPNFDEKVLKD